jgi:3-oxoacyl-[acyl-carrier protein] reductase
VLSLGRRSLGITADVRDQSDVNRMVRETMQEFGRIDILVNVVGGSWGETFRGGGVLEIEPGDVMEAYRLNLLTMFMCTRAVQPIMKSQGKKLSQKGDRPWCDAAVMSHAG